MSDQLYPGSKVIITTGNGSVFTGVLHSFDESLGKFVLKKVSTSGSRLCGLQNFYYSDMTKLQVIKETPRSSTKKSPLPNNNEGNNFMSIHPEMSIPHLEMSIPHLEMSIPQPEMPIPHPEMPIPDVHPMEAETINADASALANTNGTENGCVHNGESELLDGNHDNSLLNVNDEYYEQDYYTFIYRLGGKFYEAIDYIMGQEAVGVTFDGVDIGRDGILSVIQISTETDIIAFDILELGKEAFVEGLQAFFESSKIVKVIHDCRWISDMLYEQLKIRMANIFDTQVANVCVHRILHNGSWPRYVESLPTCLVKHLKLQPEDVTFSKVKDGVQERPGQSAWLQRPLSKEILSAAQKNVSYLTQLHQVLLNKMLYEFRMGVEIYMSHVRNMGGEIKSCQKQGYLLPPIFWKIPKLVNLTCGDGKGQNKDKSDIQGKDLPAPKKVFLSHNSVRPKPKEPAACERDSEPQDKNVVKYDSKGNAYIVLDRNSIDFWLNDTVPGMTSSSFNNVENGSLKLNRERLQDQSLGPQGDIGCGNVQNLSLPSSLQRSDVHSKTRSQGDTNVQEFNGSDSFFSASINKHGEKNNDSKYEKAQFNVLSQTNSNAELGECQKNKNNLTSPDITGQSIEQNTSIQQQDQLKASSDQCQPTHKNKLSGEHKDIVLPIENTSLTTEQPSSDNNSGIRRSKLWQMFCSNEIKEAKELPSHSNGLDSHLHLQDLLPKTIPDNDTDSRRAMPKLVKVQNDIESDSRNDPHCGKSIPKLVRVNHDVESVSRNDPDSRKAVPKLVRGNQDVEAVSGNDPDSRNAIPKLVRVNQDVEAVSGNDPDSRNAIPKLVRVNQDVEAVSGNDPDSRNAIPKLVRVNQDVEAVSGNDPDSRRVIPKLVRVNQDVEAVSGNDPDSRNAIPKLVKVNQDVEAGSGNDPDSRRVIPKLVRDHHDTQSVSGNDPDYRRAMPKLARVHTESASRKSLSESSDCDNTPGRSYSGDQLCTSRLSASFHSQSPSSDSESSLAHQLYAELNISKGKTLDCCSFLPAGFDATRVRKKKITDQSQSHKSDSEYESNSTDFLSLSLDEDLCYIPMQGSIKCRQELPLGVTSFDFGDHLSDAECNNQPEENAPCCEDAGQVSHADSINEDESLCQFQKSDVFQKVLKMASSLPFENLKSKLLPSKVSLYSK